MAGFTRRQLDVLRFIQTQIFETGVSPSYQEIAEAVGMKSKSRVSAVVHALVERGAITTLPGRDRSIRLIGHHQHKYYVRVPADPSHEEFELAKATALAAEKLGEDVFFAFWQAMTEPYQRES